MTHTLEQNLNILRVIGLDDLAERIGEMRPADQPDAAALAVRRHAPIRDAILDASDEQLPSVVASLLVAEVPR